MTYYDEIRTQQLIAERYRVVRELGRGAFGVVFQATHEVFGQPDVCGLEFRTVAVKLFTNELVTRATNLREMFKEAIHLETLAARARAQGAQPRVVEIFDVGVDGRRRPFVVMEYVQGGSLADQLRGQVPLARAVELVRLICAGVKLAHENGIVHRDLKPANVLFTSESFLKVSDFGVAVRRADALLAGGGGTISYAAPERVGSPAYDVYALGIILLQLLLRRNPLDDLVERYCATAEHASEAVRTGYARLAELRDPVKGVPVVESLVELRLDDGIQDIIRRCLAVDPGDRYSNAGELDAALERWEHGRAQPLPVRRRRSVVEVLAAAESHVGSGASAEAEALLLEALGIAERNPTEPHRTALATVHFRLVQIYEKRQCWVKAIKHQEQHLRLGKETPAALLRLAELYERDGKLLEARVSRNRANRLSERKT